MADKIQTDPDSPVIKRHKPVADIVWRLMSLVLLLVIIFGLLLAFDQNFRAAVLHSKFQSYTYVNSKTRNIKCFFTRDHLLVPAA